MTKQTFDAYLYQLVEGKQKFASQIMTSKSPVRSAEDIDETALSYAEIKMLPVEVVTIPPIIRSVGENCSHQMKCGCWTTDMRFYLSEGNVLLWI